MKVKKILGLIIIFVLLAGLSVMTYFGTSHEKKAIIILPGLPASALYGVEDGKKYWDPLEVNNITYSQFADPDFFSSSIIGDVIGELLSKFASGYLNDFGLNDEGVPNIEMRGAQYGENGQYGAIDSYKEAYLSLNAEFGSEYEVFVYNFDFRRSINHIVSEFESFLKSKNYKEIILVSHSMGGVVASNFLGKSQANRDLVSLNIACGVPFFGTHTALVALDSPIDYLLNILGPTMEPVLNLVKDLLEGVVQNMGGIYDLMPNEYFFDDPALNGGSVVQVDGINLSYEEYIAFLQTRKFALKSDNLNVKPMFNTFLDTQSVYYVDGIHSTKLVNTHYFVGVGYNTLSTIKYTSGKIDLPNSIYTDGDAVVTPFEATVGLPLNSSNVTVIEESHVEIITDYINIEAKVSELIRAL